MVHVTTRRRILGYLEDHADASAAQIGRGLGLAPASVRYHLGMLRQDGRVEFAGVRARGSKGRPTKLYRRSELVRGNNLAGLARVLLDAVSTSPRDRRDATLVRVAQGLEEQVGSVHAGNAPASRKLNVLVERLRQIHYEASWEAGSLGPRILFGHCPYAAVIADHPELCQVDAQMLQSKLGVDVTQLAKIDPRLGEPAHCVFALR